MGETQARYRGIFVTGKRKGNPKPPDFGLPNRSLSLDAIIELGKLAPVGYRCWATMDRTSGINLP